MRCNSCCDVLHCCHTHMGVSKFFVYVVVKWMPVQSNALLHQCLSSASAISADIC